MATVTYPTTDLPTAIVPHRLRRTRLIVLAAALFGLALIGGVLYLTMGFTCG